MTQAINALRTLAPMAPKTSTQRYTVQCLAAPGEWANVKIEPSTLNEAKAYRNTCIAAGWPIQCVRIVAQLNGGKLLVIR